MHVIEFPAAVRRDEMNVNALTCKVIQVNSEAKKNSLYNSAYRKVHFGVFLKQSLGFFYNKHELI